MQKENREGRQGTVLDECFKKLSDMLPYSDEVLSAGKEYANLQEVYEALQRREVKGMLIDAFTVGSKKELFNRRDLRISKILDYSSAYGVALGGEAKKLQKCFQKFVSEQRSDISRILQNNVDTIEVVLDIVARGWGLNHDQTNSLWAKRKTLSFEKTFENS